MWNGEASLNGKIENIFKYTPEYAVNNIISEVLLVGVSTGFSIESMKSGVVATEDARTLKLPPIVSGPFYAYREVFVIPGVDGGGRKFIVRLTETYPSPGRIWCRCYNTDASKWSGWSSVGGSTY